MQSYPSVFLCQIYIFVVAQSLLGKGKVKVVLKENCKDTFFGWSSDLISSGANSLVNYSCGLSPATIEYSCPSVCLSVCVCVCVHDN